MRITYDEVRKDSEVIASEFKSSENEIPSFFSSLNRVKVHLITYSVFICLAYFFMPAGSEKLEWFLMAGFGFINWMFILGFIFGYDYLFSVISNQKTKSLKLVKIIRSKIRGYGLVWLVMLVALGVASILSELNIAALVIGNFIITIFGLFIFNVDMSRYQVASLIGVSTEVKKSFKS